MTKARFIAGTLALAVVALVGRAPDALAEGFYVQVRGGPTFMTDPRNDVGLPFGGLSVSVDAETNTGFNVSGSGGYKFDFGVRVEGEVAYRKNGVDRLRVVGIGVPAKGSFSSTAFMVNGFYDFDNKSRWTPYVGGGLGLARVSVNNVGVNVGGGSITLANDTDTVFAYQAGAGVAVEVMQNLEAVLDYRYFATMNPSFRHRFGGRFDSQYKTHNITVGLRYTF